MHLGPGRFCIDHGMLQSENFLQSFCLITRIFFHTIKDNSTKTNIAKKDTLKHKTVVENFHLISSGFTVVTTPNAIFMKPS